MDELHQFLVENHSIIFVISILWGVLWFWFLLWRRKQRGLYIPKTSDQNVVFVERFVSGYSHRSWVTKFGGAANCLTIIVTQSHLVITSFFPFTAIAGIYDLEHSVSILNFIDLTIQDKEADVEFKRADDTVCKLTLRLKDLTGFEAALQNEINR